MGLVIVALMAGASLVSQRRLSQVINPDPAKAASWPRFLVRSGGFRLPRHGPVTIAVDSYGPVTDNAQSVYELSTIEQIPGIERN